MALELRFTIPGQVERLVPLDQPHMKIGALLSNQVVLRAAGVDPIHALIEEDESGGYIITDLGSATGVKVNGHLVNVEERLKNGDQLQIGSVFLTVVQTAAAAVPAAPPAFEKAAAGGDPVGRATVRAGTENAAARRQASDGMTAVGDTKVELEPERKKEMLFSPRKARPSGDVLEVVAYWGDTVLEVELFHPTFKKFDEVTIGDPTKAHFIAAGKNHIDSHPLANFSGSGYKVHLLDGMQARLRKGGKVEKAANRGDVSLGNRDIAHIKYGAVSYFLMFVRPPALDFPKSGPRDPFFLGLMSFVMLLYMVLVPMAWLHTPAPEKKEKDDIWQVVQVPEKDKKQEKEKQKKPEEKKKPEIKVAEKKTPPKKPPPPKPKEPIKPAKAVEKEKPQQTKPVEKPVEQKKPTEVLTEHKAPPAPTQQKEQSPKPGAPGKVADNKAQGPAANDKKAPGPQNNSAAVGPKSADPTKAPGPKADLNKLKANGMPSTGTTKPDFKLAGPTLPNTALGKSGGVVGSGMNQTGGARKGNQKADFMGVEGVNNNKASGVNLSKLGLGVGKIMSKTGPGAINTNFKDSAGGAGGGMGSASKTYGLGGVGGGKSLGLAGSGSSVNNFGSGSGGLLGGQGGSGGGGGNGLAGAFGGGGGGGGGLGGGGLGGGGSGAGGHGGHGRANVEVPPGDPVVSGGLTAQEIMAVIRANLNQIRHCYEQLLQRSPNAAGKIGTAFTIDTSGRVSTVNVAQDTIGDSMMRGCVTGKIQRWAFPKPRGGQPVSVNYPFVFNPL